MNDVTGRLEKFQNGVDETWEWGRIRGRTPLPIMGRSGPLKWPALMLQRKCNGVRVFYNTFLENQGNFLKALNIFEKSTYLFIFLFFYFFIFFIFFIFCIFYLFIYLFIYLHFLCTKERKKVVCFDSLDLFYFPELLRLSYYLLSSFTSNYW